MGAMGDDRPVGIAAGGLPGSSPSSSTASGASQQFMPAAAVRDELTHILRTELLSHLRTELRAVFAEVLGGLEVPITPNVGCANSALARVVSPNSSPDLLSRVGASSSPPPSTPSARLQLRSSGRTAISPSAPARLQPRRGFSIIRLDRVPDSESTLSHKPPVNGNAWNETAPLPFVSRAPSPPKALKTAVSKLLPAIMFAGPAPPPSQEPPHLVLESPTSASNGPRSAGEAHEEEQQQSIMAVDSSDLVAGKPFQPPWPPPDLVTDITDIDELPDQQPSGLSNPTLARPFHRVTFRELPGRNSKLSGRRRSLAWSPASSPVTPKSGDSSTKLWTRAASRENLTLDDNPENLEGGAVPSTPIRSSVEMELAHTRWGKDLLRETVQARSAPHVFISKIVVSNWFDFGMCVVLLLNAITIGIQVEHMAQQDGQALSFTNSSQAEALHNEDPPTEFDSFEQVFCAVFSIELALRAYVFRWDFFGKDEWRWNLFDTLLVSLQLIEEIMRITAQGDGVGARNIKQLKMLRTLRLFRALRVLRIVKFIQELSNIMYLIVGSFASFFWTFALLSLLIYISGTFMTQLVSDHIDYETNITQALAMREHFGSIDQSVMSLFQAISGGIDWKDLTNPVHPIIIGGLMQWIFAIYIAFGVLVMLNLVTGVFVEGARTLRERDKHLDLVRKLRSVLDLAKIQAGGDISWEEFEDQLHRPQLTAFFDALSIDHSEAKTVFDLLDIDGGGVISAEEFVLGGLRLQGPARAIELAKFSLENESLTQRLLDELVEIREAIGELKADAGGAALATQVLARADALQ